MIRVRFAPSPTGYLHIGGVRTALFNYLFAKNQKGKFILRIEDSDKKRSKKEYLDEILDSLKWLGLDWDELYFQSQRLDIYKEYAEKLLKLDKAYLGEAKQAEGEEDLTEDVQAIILKMPVKKIKIQDIIHGEIEFDTSIIKDQVLIKSDGMPTYNFACVVDDADLKISHVIRGDDHISNTPKQIVIYEALGFKIPQFAHLPMILAEEGGRLSKRKGATAISDFRKLGYLPEGLLNYIMLLGWSPGENREIISLNEAVKKFSVEKVNKTAAAFSFDKLDWLNNQYLKQIDIERLTDLVIPLLKEKSYIKEDFDREYLKVIVRLFQPRISNLTDFIEWSDFIFLKEPIYDPEAKEKFLDQTCLPAGRDLSKEFNLLIERLKTIEPFDTATIESAFRNVVAELNLKASDLVHPVRVALTGKTIGPGLFETIEILGKEKTVERLDQAIKFAL